MARFGVGNGTLSEWLRGVEPPGWTRRPRAKDDLHALAVELRLKGATVPQIAERLGVSRSSAYLWTRDHPLDATPEEASARRSRHSRKVADARWAPVNRARDERRAAVTPAERAWVGDLSAREIRLLGAVSYWCEGAKAKVRDPHRCRVSFINSDPGLILLFLRFVEAEGVDRRSLRYRVSIHASADIAAAESWWAGVVGVQVERFSRTTVKKHNPATTRHNISDAYRGCLTVVVPRSRELYWRIEGLMSGIVDAGAWRAEARM